MPHLLWERVPDFIFSLSHKITNDIHPSWGLPSKMLSFTRKLNKCEISKVIPKNSLFLSLSQHTHTHKCKTVCSSYWGRSPNWKSLLPLGVYSWGETENNAVIKKDCVICKVLSQHCHTLTDMNLHKQIIFSAPINFMWKYVGHRVKIKNYNVYLELC